MSVKLLTEHHLEFLSLKGGCIGSSKSTLVKMSNCWKSLAAAHSHYKLLNFEPVSSVRYNLQRVFQSACASSQSNLPEETLNAWLSIEHPSKICRLT